MSSTDTEHRKSDTEYQMERAGDSDITWEQLAQHLDASVAQFLERDAYLIEKDVNERSMTHRFAIYLQDRLPGFHVDCEYNRDGGLPKRLQVRERVIVGDDDTNGTTIYPDIIVHQRGTDCNILVIEAKKAGVATDPDREKIVAFMSDERFKYRFGAQLIFGNGPLRIEYWRIPAHEERQGNEL